MHNNIYSRCKQCGAVIEKTNKYDYSSKYCGKCKKLIRKKRNHEYYIKTKLKS